MPSCAVSPKIPTSGLPTSQASIARSAYVARRASGRKRMRPAGGAPSRAPSRRAEGTRMDVTRLLVDWSDGDATALERLVPIVYNELRRIARRELRRESVGHTLQPTGLVNELYLRLV